MIASKAISRDQAPSSMSSLPIVDVSALRSHNQFARNRAANQIGEACREFGFFYAVGHGIPQTALSELFALSRAFFARPKLEKMEIAMKHGGRAWRGYFPLEGELTSGVPDLKEGIYFGTELGEDDPRVRDRLPMHGPNLFPAHPKELKSAVRTYMAAATEAAHTIAEGIALSLGQDSDYFRRNYTYDPTVLFRIFRYPDSRGNGSQCGVGEHTDYGFLTLLAQDDAGGLEVKTEKGWIGAPPVPGTLVCNIGDMLDRLTGGTYKSTPHRVRNTSGSDRISFPLFFDPAFDAQIRPLPDAEARDDSTTRWDRQNVHSFEGTYGDYLLGKVAKVFPDLRREINDTR